MAIFAIDFDCTIAKPKNFPECGELIEYVPYVIRNLRHNGHELHVWTCRTDSPKTKSMALTKCAEFLKNEGLLDLFTSINGHASGLWEDFARPIKMCADVYFDDRGYGAPLIADENGFLIFDWKKVISSSIWKEWCPHDIK